MEEKKQSHWLFRKFFAVLEIVLIAFSGMALYLHYYTDVTATGLLLIMGLGTLSASYMIKAFNADAALGFKPRIIYFCCAFPCVALLFALMFWPLHTLLLVAGLACMSLGWGVFIWSKSRQRDPKAKTHIASQQASTHMMLFRLVLYTVACLGLLLDHGMA